MKIAWRPFATVSWVVTQCSQRNSFWINLVEYFFSWERCVQVFPEYFFKRFLCVKDKGQSSGRPSVKSAKGKTCVSGKLFFMSMFTTKLMKATGENFIAAKKWLIEASRIQMTCKHSYRVCRCQWSLPGVRLEKEQRNGIRTKNK